MAKPIYPDSLLYKTLTSDVDPAKTLTTKPKFTAPTPVPTPKPVETEEEPDASPKVEAAPVVSPSVSRRNR